VTELKMSGSISVAMTPDDLNALASDVARIGAPVTPGGKGSLFGSVIC
jgi:hypothetical protein